ncbi:hypothetical protein [Erwinia amylovora]|uniref:hypothetical protein n=1 Tax=Erwinia amylovora TaxID=552 RepID=UPI0020BF675E|nr:hypothetical protein [Erwinia amylovora]MCK8205094.1 hypothetical protein [Erwinia amylovora]
MSKEDSNAPAPSAVWNLVPLTPEYLEAEHSGYVSALEVALEGLIANESVEVV